MATEEQKAALTTERGKQAADIKDPDEKKRYIAGSASVDTDYEGTANSTAIEANKLQNQKVLGSLKKGGTIPKTGLYKLHKDEKVIPANKAKMMNKKMDMASMGLAGKPPADKPARVKKTTHMSIEPTDNKGFIVRHEEHENGIPNGKRKHHAFPDAASMHKHVMKTFPAKAMPEAAPDATPAAQPAPTASPMPAAGAPQPSAM